MIPLCETQRKWNVGAHKYKSEVTADIVQNWIRILLEILYSFIFESYLTQLNENTS